MMLRQHKWLFFVFFFSIYFLAKGEEIIDLSGKWDYRLIGAPSSIPGEGSIVLPNTLDNAKKSVYNPESDNTNQLRREFSFIGEATYSRNIEVPSDWMGKDLLLKLERTKPSVVKIDGEVVGTNSRISSPQYYNLTSYLSPGKHKLEVVVNNSDSIPPIVARSSHAVSESTQTNWNGILGDIRLEVRNPFNIKSIRIDDRNIESGVVVYVFFSSPNLNSRAKVELNWKGKKYTEEIAKGADWVEFYIPVDEENLWSSRNPVLFNLVFSLFNNEGKKLQDYEITTGFRNFSQNGEYFTVNGRPIFLRGNVNAAVFPKTTFPPLDEESWSEYYKILKNYGINHVRFHSWTPPEAAFKAADKEGIYLMIELPIWGELDRDLKFHNRFLREDLMGIIEAYSHHPSLVLFSTGNELWGDISLMGEYMKIARAGNPRMLSTYGSNVYLGMNGLIGEEDFLVSSKTSDNIDDSVRGSVSFADSSTGGHFNSKYPDSNSNFSGATNGLSVPVISHEVGQYQSYPDFNEINKYEGNLKPDNLKEFEKRAKESGTFRKSSKYKDSSGKWAAKLYKAEMEMALRTPGIGGIQLFGLQDYPGQGMAVIGLLNPFMEDKGFIEPEKWRQSSSDLMLVAEFPKFIFESGEKVEIPVLSVNFSDMHEGMSEIKWETEFSKGTLKGGKGVGIMNVGNFEMTMPNLKEPRKMILKLSSEGNKIENEYEFWVYPKKFPEVKNVIVTTNIENALSELEKGKRVVLLPDSATVAKASLDPLFITDFWNYRMYRTICDEMHLSPSPGTLGLLVNPSHPSLQKFPTDNHTDWQWYSIVSASRPLIIDRLPDDIDPVVEVIDNVERNFRLALMLECNVGKGKLMILSANLSQLESTPEGRWLLQSIKEYMASKSCNPEITLSPEQVMNLLTKPSNARMIKELKNETYRGW